MYRHEVSRRWRRPDSISVSVVIIGRFHICPTCIYRVFHTLSRILVRVVDDWSHGRRRRVTGSPSMVP